MGLNPTNMSIKNTTNIFLIKLTISNIMHVSHVNYLAVFAQCQILGHLALKWNVNKSRTCISRYICVLTISRNIKVLFLERVIINISLSQSTQREAFV